MIGTTEVLVIGGIVLVLFGSTALPKFFRSIGKAQTEFEKGRREGEKEGILDQNETPHASKDEPDTDR